MNNNHSDSTLVSAFSSPLHLGLIVNCLFLWAVVTEEQKKSQPLKNWGKRLKGSADKSRTWKYNPSVSFTVPIDWTWSAAAGTQVWNIGSNFS